MKESTLSAGIVTYNNSAEIADCLRSLIEYTQGINLQIYVYDNQSKDDTVEIIHRRFPQVHVIEGEENQGFGYGHNRIIEAVDSDFHMVVNPDITFTENVVQKLAVFMARYGQVGQVTPMIKNPDGSEQLLPKKDPTFAYVILSKFPPFRYYRADYTRANEKFRKPTRILSSTGCFSMIRTSVLKELGGYDERFFMYFEDADLSRRIRQKYDIVFYPNTFVYHAWKRDNTRSLRGIRIFLTSMVKYFWKWK